MLIERTTDKSILPEAVDSLVTSDNVSTYCGEYNPPKRPPLGIYNISLHKVVVGFRHVLDALDTLQQEQPFRDEKQYGTKFDARLVESQENLIKSIQEYFDGCMDTLRCFYPAAIGDRTKVFWKDPVVDSYWSAIKDKFFDPISEIANHIKHDEGRLILLVMFNDEYAIPGYYAEAVDEYGRIVPYRKIHQPFRSKLDPTAGYDTAFSFARDLRYLLWGIYFVSHHLATAINTITRNIQPTKYAAVGKMDGDILEISRRVAGLPKRFYSDELYKDLPTVEVIDNDQETTLRLAYPGTDLLIASDGKHMNLVPLVSDGISKQFKFPYLIASDLDGK